MSDTPKFPPPPEGWDQFMAPERAAHARHLLRTAHLMHDRDQHELVCLRPDAFELLSRMLTMPHYSEAEVLNAARCAGINEEQWLKLKAYLPAR